MPPEAQSKLLWVVRGAIFDVVVDLRFGSITFGRYMGVSVSAEDWVQLFIPEGFAHGFCTLVPDTEVYYKLSRPYSPQHERGIMWNDPDLAIVWPFDPDAIILSERDRGHPQFHELPRAFSL